MSSDPKPDTPDPPGGLDTAVDALTRRMHDELTRQVRSAFDELLAKAQAESNRAPGSEIEGIPASVITATDWPACNRASSWAVRRASLCS